MTKATRVMPTRITARERRRREDQDDIRAALAVMNDPDETYAPLGDVMARLGLRERTAPKNGSAVDGEKGSRKRTRGLPTGRREFVVTIENGEDGWLVVDCPAIPGCMSQGKSETEALASIREAIRLCLEVRSEEGLPLTVATRVVEIDFGTSRGRGARSPRHR